MHEFVRHPLVYLLKPCFPFSLPQVLRTHVMVRVGGGWDTLEHYLDKHDPCRCAAFGEFTYYSSSGPYTTTCVVVSLCKRFRTCVLDSGPGAAPD